MAYNISKKVGSIGPYLLVSKIIWPPLLQGRRLPTSFALHEMVWIPNNKFRRYLTEKVRFTLIYKFSPETLWLLMHLQWTVFCMQFFANTCLGQYLHIMSFQQQNAFIYKNQLLLIAEESQSRIQHNMMLNKMGNSELKNEKRKERTL